MKWSLLAMLLIVTGVSFSQTACRCPQVCMMKEASEEYPRLISVEASTIATELDGRPAVLAIVVVKSGIESESSIRVLALKDELASVIMTLNQENTVTVTNDLTGETTLTGEGSHLFFYPETLDSGKVELRYIFYVTKLENGKLIATTEGVQTKDIK